MSWADIDASVISFACSESQVLEVLNFSYLLFFDVRKFLCEFTQKKFF